MIAAFLPAQRRSPRPLRYFFANLVVKGSQLPNRKERKGFGKYAKKNNRRPWDQLLLASFLQSI